MWSTAREVAAGDTVIIWLTRDNLTPLVIDPSKDFNTKFGNFKQADFIGVPYGSKVPSKSGPGFLHLLRPTPELWTLALPHRTQILYLADIAFISSYLNIRPGSTVIEAGTGSASFSHSIARTIGDTGRLYSFEFHEARFLKARDEFTRHGLSPARVTLTHRNVCKDGFDPAPAASVDAVFLDLPAPWDAVPHARAALRNDRTSRICCFSPCIEQVLRTVSALNEAGFTEITTYETLLRPLEVFQIPPPPPIGPLAAKLKAAEVRREEKRQRQIAANRAQQAAVAAAASTSKIVDAEEDAEMQPPAAPTGTKRRPSRSPSPSPSPSLPTVATPALPATPAIPSTTHKAKRPRTEGEPTEPEAPRARVNVAKALVEVRGHTSYLTFACLAPVPGAVRGGTTAEAVTAQTVNGADAVEATAAVSESVVEVVEKNITVKTVETEVVPASESS